MNPDQLTCFDWAAGGSAGVAGAGGAQEGPYFHMVCTYFPISMDNTPANTIFPAANASQYACGSMFGRENQNVDPRPALGEVPLLYGEDIRSENFIGL